MSAVLQRPHMSREEFLAWDATPEGWFEYDGDGPVAMVGGTRGHAGIARNLLGLLWQALPGTPCQPSGGDLRIDVDGSYRLPDVFVACTRGGRSDLAVRDPVVVFEVLSPSAAATDLTVRNRECRNSPSIRRYVVIEQDRGTATVYAREATEWVGRLIDGEDSRLDMPEIGISLRLGDLYEGVEFASPPA